MGGASSGDDMVAAGVRPIYLTPRVADVYDTYWCALDENMSINYGKSAHVYQFVVKSMTRLRGSSITLR